MDSALIKATNNSTSVINAPQLSGPPLDSDNIAIEKIKTPIIAIINPIFWELKYCKAPNISYFFSINYHYDFDY